MMEDKYFDNNATTRLIPEVKHAINELLSIQYGNPSSPHSFGSKAVELITTAKEVTADFFNCRFDDILYTSCASESNTIVLQSVLSWGRGHKTVVTTPVEHSSVKENCEKLSGLGVSVVELPVEHNGVIEIEKLMSVLKQTTVSLVSIGWVNNETGVIQPIKEVSEICRNNGVLLHVDASQAFGRIDINLEDVLIDYLVFTGHKLHAPKGIGGLISNKLNLLKPIVLGGDQQNGLRAGTENILGIHALGAALAARKKSMIKCRNKLTSLRDAFEFLLLKSIDGLIVNGSTENRVCNTSNICFGPIDGRALIAQLDNVGVICSQTSACTSQIPEPSPTLLAMGLSEAEAFGSIRVSFGIDNTMQEVEQAVPIFKEIVSRVRAFSIA